MGERFKTDHDVTRPQMVGLMVNRSLLIEFRQMALQPNNQDCFLVFRIAAPHQSGNLSNVGDTTNFIHRLFKMDR